MACTKKCYNVGVGESSQIRVAVLKKQLGRLDYVCSGNLRLRHSVCGTKNCLCKGEKPKPHGPYYYWSRLIGGKVVQRILSPEQAKLVAKGIANYRKARQLLRRWEADTTRLIEAKKAAAR